MAHQQLERALNAHLGGGVEVRADGSIAIASARIMVETVDLLTTGTVVIRVRSVAPGDHLRAVRRLLLGLDD